MNDEKNNQLKKTPLSFAKTSARKFTLSKIRYHCDKFASTLKARLNADGDALAIPVSDCESKSAASAKSENAKKILRGCIMFAVSFVFSRAQMAFGTYPLGISVICAENSMLVYSLAGAVLGTFISSVPRPIYIFAYVLSIIVRWAVCMWLYEKTPSKNKKKISVFADLADKIKTLFLRTFDTDVPIFNETLYLRMASSVVVAFFVGIYSIIAGGYLYFDLFGAIFMMIACPAAVFLFSGAFDKDAEGTFFFDAAIAAFMFAFVFSLRGAYFIGISLGIIAAFLITLYSSIQWGVVKGAIFGLLCGFAVSPVLALILCISGIIAGALKRHSVFIASFCATVIGSAFAFYVNGFNAFTKDIPALIVAALVFYLLDRAALLPASDVFGKTSFYNTRAYSASSATSKSFRDSIAQAKQTATSDNIAYLSDTLLSLSDVFYNISDRLRRPTVFDLRQICDSACDKFCENCSTKTLCWDREYGSTMDILNKMAAELHKNGRISSEAIPKYMLDRCKNLGKIIDEANSTCAKTLEAKIKSDKTEIFAIDYEALSKILKDTLEKSEAEFKIDEEFSAKLRRAISSPANPLKFRAENVLVYGDRKKQITVSQISGKGLHSNSKEIQKYMETLVGTKISTPTFEIADGKINMHVHSVKRFSAEFAKATSAAANTDENGDSISFFENKEDYFYSLISDGMGSGREAALTSKISSVFLEKMLSCGNSKNSSLQMLNSFVRSKSIESSATIDLMEIDMISGSLCFIKSGAAPSYVRRGGNIFKLQSKTAPIGIMRVLDAEQIKFDIEDGDVIIMLSDGISVESEENIWLLNILADSWEDDLQVMADKIIREAILSGNRKDDMTVGIIKIKDDFKSEEKISPAKKSAFCERKEKRKEKSDKSEEKSA